MRTNKNDIILVTQLEKFLYCNWGNSKLSNYPGSRGIFLVAPRITKINYRCSLVCGVVCIRQYKPVPFILPLSLPKIPTLYNHTMRLHL